MSTPSKKTTLNPVRLFVAGVLTIAAYGLTQPFLMRLYFSTAEAKINQNAGELRTLCDSSGDLNPLADVLGAIGFLGRASFAIKMLYNFNSNNQFTRKNIIPYAFFFILCGIPAGLLNAYNTYNAGVYFMYKCITPTRSEPIPIPLIIAGSVADFVPATTITIILPPAIISEIKDWITLLTQCTWSYKPLFPKHNRHIQLSFNTTAQLKALRDTLLNSRTEQASTDEPTSSHMHLNIHSLPKRFYFLKALLFASMYLAREACLNYLTYSRSTITATSEHFFPNNNNHSYNFTRPHHNIFTDAASNSSEITSLLLNGLLLNSVFFGLLLRCEKIDRNSIKSGLAVLIPALCISIPGMVNTLFNDELTQIEKFSSCAASLSTTLVFVMLGLTDFVKKCFDPKYEPHDELIEKILKLEKRREDSEPLLISLSSPPPSPQ